MSALFRYWLIAWLGVIALQASPASNASDPALVVERTNLLSPAGPGAFGGSLVKGPDGTLILSWVEPAGRDEHVLKFAALDLAARRWSVAQTIARGRDWVAGHANLPVLAVQSKGRMTAVWCVNNPLPPHAGHHAPARGHHHASGCHALVSQSEDGGVNWSTPQPLTRESDVVEFVSLQPLADGQVLAAWLDGRAKKDGKPQRLYARLLGSDQPDRLVDESVCDCCQTTLTGFPDGSALLAYRSRAEGEVRDILTARFIDGKWERRRTQTDDGWVIAGCPVNGPRLVSDGPRVVKTWFTAANGEPRVLASTSADAGGVFTLSQRIDLGRPTGRVDALILRDGTQLLTWVEGPGDDPSQPGGVYLRRLGAGGGMLQPAQLVATADLRANGFPRIALAKDYDATPAQLVLVHTRAGEIPQLQTTLVTLPSTAVLEEMDSACGCVGRGDQLIGYPMRAQILAVSSEGGTVRVKHRAIPGIMRAGEHEFKAAPALLTVLKPGSDVLARIEQRGGEWWMFDVRILLNRGSG